jgi:hypothetical protein
MSQRLPTPRNDADEAAFWDEHDATDFLADLEPDHDTVFVRPEAGIVELGQDTWREIARVARRRKTTPARLVRRWLHEKLRQHRTTK